VHAKLLACGIHAGKNVSQEFQELGETALYCVTEVHTKADIDALADALEKILPR
jgi:glycine dehydrogenase subunit 1